MRQDESAVGQVVAFLVAGVIFLGVVGAVLVATTLSGKDRTGADAAASDAEAAALADVLVGSPGVGWEDGPDWLDRLGLAHPEGGLDAEHLASLRGAALEANGANGKVDYDEAKASLGLDPSGTRDFHLRIYPVLDDYAGAGQPPLRVAYIADWNGEPSATLPAGIPAADAQAQANALLNRSMAPDTALERDALDALPIDFHNNVYTTAASGPGLLIERPFPLPPTPLLPVLGTPVFQGDVYPDAKDYLSDVLPGRLVHYDAIVVGSGVDHNQMTPNAIKDAIRDWTLAGGSLIVLGSDSQAYNWLEPLFQVGIRTANGAALAPDVGHPILHQPFDLEWSSYDFHDKAWDIKNEAAFNHILVVGDQDILAVSMDGSLGAGRVLLTTLLPREIAREISDVEAEHFFANVLALEDFSHLYLDYGPTIPPGQAIALAARQSWIDDAVLLQAPVRIEVYLWG